MLFKLPSVLGICKLDLKQHVGHIIRDFFYCCLPLSSEWVNNVWEEDFTQLPQVPQVLEDLTGDTMNLGKNLKMTIRELSVASEGGTDQSGKTFSLLHI